MLSAFTSDQAIQGNLFSFDFIELRKRVYSVLAKIKHDMYSINFANRTITDILIAKVNSNILSLQCCYFGYFFFKELLN